VIKDFYADGGWEEYCKWSDWSTGEIFVMGKIYYISMALLSNLYVVDEVEITVEKSIHYKSLSTISIPAGLLRAGCRVYINRFTDILLQEIRKGYHVNVVYSRKLSVPNTGVP
jgi:hypothetical protein